MGEVKGESQPEPQPEPLKPEPEEEIKTEKVEEPASIENSSEAKELSPEVIEKIMEKVQDIDTEGIAYSTLSKTNLSSSEDVEKFYRNEFVEILHQGILGRPQNIGRKSITPSEWVKYVRKQKKGEVFFNIVGRTTDTHDHYGKSKIDQSFWMRWINEDKYNEFVTLLFNVERLRERNPMEWSEMYDNPSEKRARSFRVHKSGLSQSRTQPLKTDSGYGFFASYRIPPRDFEGLMIKIARPMLDEEIMVKLRDYHKALPKDYEEPTDEILQYEKKEDTWRWMTDLPTSSEMQERVSLITDVMISFWHEEGTPLLPIYDNAGNLWWPKEMNYEEVKKFVEEREKNKS